MAKIVVVKGPNLQGFYFQLRSRVLFGKQCIIKNSNGRSLKYLPTHKFCFMGQDGATATTAWQMSNWKIGPFVQTLLDQNCLTFIYDFWIMIARLCLLFVLCPCACVAAVVNETCDLYLLRFFLGGPGLCPKLESLVVACCSEISRAIELFLLARSAIKLYPTHYFYPPLLHSYHIVALQKESNCVLWEILDLGYHAKLAGHVCFAM